jgi:UDP-glucose 4-epimerase
MINNLLVPGGLGFIGSHTIIELFQKTKTNIIIVDDMSNCFNDVLDRIKTILSSKATK